MEKADSEWNERCNDRQQGYSLFDTNCCLDIFESVKMSSHMLTYLADFPSLTCSFVKADEKAHCILGSHTMYHFVLKHGYYV